MPEAFAAVVAVACVGALGVLCSALPGVWRGQVDLPSGPLRRLLRIDSRSYPAFLLWAGAALTALALGAAGLAWWPPLEVVSLLVAAATVPLALLHAWVVRQGRPRRLVPPLWREAARGWPPALPPQTDHLVELYQVNSMPGEPDLERVLYAQCGEQGCEFLEFPDPEAADEEGNLRAKAAVHSAKQTPVIQIYV